MRSIHLRRSAAAAALTVSGVLLFSGAALAADTTIVVKSDDGIVFADQPLVLSGTCAEGSTTAVVSFEQNGDTVAEKSIDLTQDGSWDTQLDISDADVDDATANVDCFAYGTPDPVGSASEDVFVVPSDIKVIDVTVSPSKVRIGASFSISGVCPAGTQVASVAAGEEDADLPFLSKTVTPAADGTVRYTGTVPTKGVDPGRAVAVILCGVDATSGFGTETFAAGDPTAFGFAEFTILAAPAAPAATPASSVPALANTGSDNGPLAAVGAGLLLLGAGAYRTSRSLR